MIKITNEAQLLNEAVCEHIIKKEIYSDENRERKAQDLRRYEIYKNKSKKWVMFSVEQEGYRPETVAQMRNRASNISVARKIINKKSQAYTGGVERKIGDPIVVEEQDPKDPSVKKKREIPNQDQVSLDLLYDELDFDSNMQKGDRYRTGFKNALVGVVPVLNDRETKKTGKKKYDLKMQVLAPWKYDVIENPNDPTKPLAVIISEFTERLSFKRYDPTGQADQGIRTSNNLSEYLSDGYDAAIADAPEDKEQDPASRRFIWWTDSYHFTTDIKGNIIRDASPDDLKNPIGRLPWETLAEDQDGSYWASGGDDVFESDILINKKQTDCNFIQFVQGWGQLVIDHEGEIPKKLIGGPDNAWIFERRQGGQPAVVTYATSNPPIESWLESIRMQLALVLSTNNLSPRNIAAKLDVNSAPSGVAMMIENSDLIADVKDSQQYFRDIEPCLFEIARSWHKTYSDRNWLSERFKTIPAIQGDDLVVKFHLSKPPVSTKEELEELKMEKDMGIITLVEMIRRRRPELTEEQAKEKAEELFAEKKRMSEFVTDVAKEGQKPGMKEVSGGDEENGAAEKEMPERKLPE